MASDFQIRHAASVIRRGGIIIYATDTIYGIGCDPRNPLAVNAVARLKQRPANKSMILLASNVTQFNGFIDYSKLPDKFDWYASTPTTWVMPAAHSCPHWLTHEDNTVAVRLTHHATVAALCKQLGSAVISTSANFSGLPPAKNKLSIQHQFGGKVHAMLFSNQASTGKPSTIKHYRSQTTIRN